MKIELEQKLFKAFPKLYRQKDLSIRETAMCWGFSCGDGWYDIIWKLSEKIEKYNEEHKKEFKEPIEAIQVKEKFGGLRFYTNYSTDEVDKWIREAEDEAWKTCERCGIKENIVHTKGWIYTLCKKCLKEEQERRGRNDE